MTKMTRECELAAFLIALLMAGCDEAPPAQQETKPPEVVVCQPTREWITDHEDFTGQTQALKTVDVLARVSGYLTKVHFRDGDEVEEGTLLFEIDPRPFQHQVAYSQAQVESNEAALRLAKANNARAKRLAVESPKAMTQQDIDSFQAAEEQAVATLDTSRATLSTNLLNLEFTRVIAPFAGRLSRRMVDPGNLVKADDTVLTRIVTQEPMYVYFDLNERTMLRIRRLVTRGVTASLEKTQVPVFMSLADEGETYPHGGQINFEDNQLDSSTGTLRVRAEFPNADRLLKPGFFVKVRIPVGERYEALMVPEQALGTDQGQKFLFVVDDADQVEHRLVKVGKLRQGMRVVIEGLSIDERVVVSGLQRVRDGIKVATTMWQAEGPETASTEAEAREVVKDDG
jgi:RND family efflux transporter MFP subunit